MKEFFRFTERNEWEGERWHFYIPMEGNKDAYDKLWDFCESTEWEPYNIDEELFPENEVDILVKHSDSGYMHYHSKLDVVLDLSKIQQAVNSGDEDLFYKGGIKHLAAGESDASTG